MPKVKPLAINCNHHAASFDANDDDNEDYPLSDDCLGMSGDWTFKYDYPLSHHTAFTHQMTPGMDVSNILTQARKDYEAIYAAEEDAAGNPGHIPGMLNRQRSAGPYGIWGHDFSDLYFEAVYIDTVKKCVTFGMGS